MADWPLPLPLITCEYNKFFLNEETVALLEQIDKQLVIVCIAGSYRTGKSYLMNRLVGQPRGFALGNTLESKTKGIWVWCRDHPKDANVGLLVMDTEGLDDPMKGDLTNDMQILALSILLSSTFIYNAVGRLDNTVMDNMEFVTEISNHMRVKSDSIDSDFDSVFPNFVLVCRDKILELRMGGKEVTADEYMERVMLTATDGATERERRRNETKTKLRKYFPERKCFFFVRPCEDDDDMLRLEELKESDLQEEFLTTSNQFCNYVHQTSPVKKLNTRPINGKIFVHLARNYIDSFNHNAIPCVSTALNSIATIENTKLVSHCASMYKKSMSWMKFPLNQAAFDWVQRRNYKKAVDYFVSKVFLEDEENYEYHYKLKDELQKEYLSCVERNYKVSEEMCYGILNELSVTIWYNLQHGIYHVHGGYEWLVEDTKKLVKRYREVPRKGVMANQVLENFLLRLRDEQLTILYMDQKLLASQQRIEEERLRIEQIRHDSEMQKEKQQRMKIEEQAMIIAHREQKQALETAHREQFAESKRHFETILSAREKEAKRLIKEKIEAERRKLHRNY